MSTGAKARRELQAALQSICDFLDARLSDIESGARPWVPLDFAARLQKASLCCHKDPTAEAWLRLGHEQSTAFLRKDSRVRRSFERYVALLENTQSLNDSIEFRVFKEKWNFPRKLLSDYTPETFISGLNWWHQKWSSDEAEIIEAEKELDEALDEANANFDYDRFYGQALLFVASDSPTTATSHHGDWLARHVVSALLRELFLSDQLKSVRLCAVELIALAGNSRRMQGDPSTEARKQNVGERMAKIYTENRLSAGWSASKWVEELV